MTDKDFLRREKTLSRDEARIAIAHGGNRAARRAARFGKKKSDGLTCVQNLPTTLYVRGLKK